MKKLTRLVSILLTLAMCVSIFVACHFDDAGDLEEIDATKTQLYVWTYNGGYGYDWLNTLKEGFEALHANDSLEPGKTGVQVIVIPDTNGGNGQKESIIKGNTKEGSPEIYFAENAPYRTLVTADALLDITDAVTSTGADGKTIESKLNDQQKEFLKVNGKYYAVPHYQGEYGLSYDVDLFDARGFYFKEGYNINGDLDEMFVAPGDTTTPRTAGPDYVTGTADDGLPRTYDEFFILCEYIDACGCIPVSWTGTYYTQYTSGLLHSLVVDHEGLDQMMINYTQNGTATDLGRMDGDTFVRDEQNTTISYMNGGEIRRQEGTYYGLSFMEELFNGYDGKYHASDLKTFGTYSHKENQKDFLTSSKESASPIAMIIEGSWWEHEAMETFEYMASKYGESYSMAKRNIAWMQLPKATMEKYEADQGNATHYDMMSAYLFVNKNIASHKVAIAKEFVKYANTDENLRMFSKTTNTLKALEYDITGADYEALSPYGKTLYSNRKNADIVYPFSTSRIFISNAPKFRGTDYYNVNDTTTAVQCLHGHESVAQVFNKICSYYDTLLKEI